MRHLRLYTSPTPRMISPIVDIFVHWLRPPYRVSALQLIHSSGCSARSVLHTGEESESLCESVRSCVDEVGYAK